MILKWSFSSENLNLKFAQKAIKELRPLALLYVNESSFVQNLVQVFTGLFYFIAYLADVLSDSINSRLQGKRSPP